MTMIMIRVMVIVMITKDTWCSDVTQIINSTRFYFNDDKMTTKKLQPSLHFHQKKKMTEFVELPVCRPRHGSAKVSIMNKRI